MPDLPDVRRKWQPIGRLWPILAAACFGLFVAVAAWLAVSIWEERLATAKFNDVAEDYAEVLQNGLNRYVGKILALRAFYDASVEVDANEFALFTNQILDGHTNKMRAIWLPYVTRAQRADFEREQIAKGLEGYAIKTWTMSGTPSISPQRDEYFPVLYSTFASKAPATLGMDLNSEPVRSRAIQRARNDNIAATAQKIMLSNPIGDNRGGFIIFVPVYQRGAHVDSKEERHNNIRGIVAGVFQTDAVIDAILSTATLADNISLYLYPASPSADAPRSIRGRQSVRPTRQRLGRSPISQD